MRYAGLVLLFLLFGCETSLGPDHIVDPWIEEEFEKAYDHLRCLGVPHPEIIPAYKFRFVAHETDHPEPPFQGGFDYPGFAFPVNGVFESPWTIHYSTSYPWVVAHEACHGILYHYPDSRFRRFWRCVEHKERVEDGCPPEWTVPIGRCRT